MTTTPKAAGNGSNDAVVTPERKSGMAYVRDAEAYHLASLAHDAAYEAERLCERIYRAASSARFADIPGNDDSAREALADPDMKERMDEAIRCIDTAGEYLYALVNSRNGHGPFTNSPL